MKKDQRLGLAPSQSLLNHCRTFFKRIKDLPIHEDIFDEQFRKAAKEHQVHIMNEDPVRLARILEEKPPSHAELMALWTKVKNGEIKV
jgi:hypothetical protein